VIVGCHIPIVNDSDSIGHPWTKGYIMNRTVSHNASTLHNILKLLFEYNKPIFLKLYVTNPVEA
jgi:hypothetical protein